MFLNGTALPNCEEAVCRVNFDFQALGLNNAEGRPIRNISYDHIANELDAWREGIKMHIRGKG